MIDSIDFLINNVSDINLSNLIAHNVKYYKLKYERSSNGKTYVKYGSVKDETDPSLISKGIGFVYNNIYFMYLAKFNCVKVNTNTHRVLNKSNITLSNRNEYIAKVSKAVKDILGVDYSKLLLHRIDYYVDLILSYDIMYEYINRLYKHKSIYQNIKRINDYETSIYLNSKYGQKRINIYDKYHCEQDKYNKAFEKANSRYGISRADYEKQHPVNFDKYKNIFRIEVQNTKVLINNESKQIYAKQGNDRGYNEFIIDLIDEATTDSIIDVNKINKNLYGYWNKESMQQYYFDFLKDFLYTGKYYKLKKAKQIIKHESSFSDVEKARLQEFITAVNQYGITNVTTNTNISEHPKWCGATVTKYMNDLEELGINVVALDSTNDKDRIKSARDKINKSSHTENWKSKLRVFVAVISKYGVANIIAKNNKEITDSSRNIKHKMWSSKIVDEYIAKLASIGINPITLNNNSKFDQLESLYKLAEDKANKDYFDIDNLDIPAPPKPLIRRNYRQRDFKINNW